MPCLYCSMSNEVFPAISSTLSPHHLEAWLSAQYGIKHCICRVLKTNINHTYSIVSCEEQYILRVYRHNHRSLRDIAAEVKLLTDLKSVVDISYPISDIRGEYIQEINALEGKRYAVLFSFAEGRKVRFPTTELIYNIGAKIGTLHHFTCNKTIDRIDYSIGELIGWAHRQLAVYIPEEMEEMQFIKASETVLSQAFGAADLPKGILHLDLWYDNMNISDSGAITFFDFDNCGNGWLILDIGYYCMQLFYSEQDKEEYERKKDAFLNGYLSKNNLPANDIELLPYAGLAIWIYYLGVPAKNFDNIGNFYLSENYVKMIIARVKEWLRYNKMKIPFD